MVEFNAFCFDDDDDADAVDDDDDDDAASYLFDPPFGITVALLVPFIIDFLVGGLFPSIASKTLFCHRVLPCTLYVNLPTVRTKGHLTYRK